MSLRQPVLEKRRREIERAETVDEGQISRTASLRKSNTIKVNMQKENQIGYMKYFRVTLTVEKHPGQVDCKDHVNAIWHRIGQTTQVGQIEDLPKVHKIVVAITNYLCQTHTVVI